LHHFPYKARYWSKILIFSYTLAFDAPIRGVPIGMLPSRLVQKKTRMAALPDGKKILRICSAVSTEYRRVTNGRQTDILRSPRYAYASRGKNYIICSAIVSHLRNMQTHKTMTYRRHKRCRILNVRCQFPNTHL